MLCGFHSVVENLSLNANSLSLKNFRNLIPGYEPEIYETAHDPDEVIFFYLTYVILGTVYLARRTQIFMFLLQFEIS